MTHGEDFRRKRIEKLPKWAQLYFAKMERDLEEAQRKLLQVTGSDEIEESNTRFRGSDYLTTHNLPDFTTVVFATKSGRFDIKINKNEKGIYVYSTEPIAIKTESANTFTVRPLTWREREEWYSDD